MTVRLQAEDFDVSAEAEALLGGRDDVGALVTFVGIVRNRDDGSLISLELEHYPGMTEKALGTIEREAISRWSLNASLIVHRYGKLNPGERIMMVATAAGHRRDAFAAAEFLMDYLKSRAPFWKRENTTAGSDWVDALPEDERALGRWANEA